MVNHKIVHYVVGIISISVLMIMLIMFTKATFFDDPGDPIETRAEVRAPQNNTYMDTATYVGSSGCVCHPSHKTSWANTLHSKMIQDAVPANVIGDFADQWLNITVQNSTSVNKSVSIFITMNGSDYVAIIQNASDPADNVTLKIARTLGSEWKQRYLVDIGNNTFILPIQWNPPTSEWVSYHPQDWVNMEGGTADNVKPENPAPSASWDKRCGGCHSTGYSVTYNATTEEYVGTYAELNVGCEACHGPGSTHVSVPDNEKKNYIWRSLDEQICGSCHARGHGTNNSSPLGEVGFSWNATFGAYMPGDTLTDYKVFQAYTPGTNSAYFWADNHSKSHRQQYNDMYLFPSHKGDVASTTAKTNAECQHCMQADGFIAVMEAGNNPVDHDTITTALTNTTNLNCNACHVTHTADNENQLRLPKADLCIACHTDYPTSGPGDSPHHHQDQILGGDVNGTVQGTAAMGGILCVDCHMPASAKSGVEYDIHSHVFDFMDPAKSLSDGVPNSCNVECHGGFNTGSENPYNDTAISGIITGWRTNFTTKVTKVDVNKTAAEAALAKYNAGYNQSAWDAIMVKYDEAMWAYENAVDDPSGGVHNPDYLITLLNRAQILFDEVALLDLGATYIGSSSCVCHSDKVTTWEDSAHAKKFLPTASATIIGDFTDDPTLNDTANSIPDITFDLTESGGVYTIKMNATVTYTIDNVIGAGVWKQRYTTKIGESIYVLPIQWNTKDGKWVAYHLEHWYDSNGDLQEVDKDDSWDKNCGGCHTTGYSVTMNDDDEYVGEYAETGIACEACHGPGSEHAAGPSTTNIIKDSSAEVCGQCHARGKDPSGTYGFPWSSTYGRTKPDMDVGGFWDFDDYTPGSSDGSFWVDNTSKKHRQQYMDYVLFPSHKGDLTSTTAKTTARCQHCMQSEGFIKTIEDGKMPKNTKAITTALENTTNIVCTTCHDMHPKTLTDVIDHQLRLEKDELCVACHTDYPSSGPGGGEPHHNAKQLLTGAVNGTIQGDPMMGGFVTCADCHMPKVATSAVAYDISSHTFKFMYPQKSIDDGTPNSCTANCHSSMTDVEAQDNMTMWKTEIEEELEIVHDNLIAAEAYIMAMDVNDPDYEALNNSYNIANWSFMNVEHDPSHGAHNFDYEMELLNHSNNLALDIIDNFEGGGKISGKVTDAATGTGIEGATVTIGTLDTVTDADGNYEIIKISAGTGLNVTVDDVMFFGYKQYHGTFNASVTVVNQESTTVNFMLTEAALPVSVSPADDATDVAVDSVITMTLQEAVDNTTLTVKVTRGGTDVAGDVTYDDSTFMVTFTPAVNFSEGASIEVTLDDGIMGIDNESILWKDKVWSFTVMTTFEVTVKVDVGGTATEVKSDMTLTNIDVDTTITVEFPMNINSSTIKISLSPGITLSLTSYNNSTYVAVYTPTTDLVQGTTYTLTLGTGLEDMDGKTLLDASMSWMFTTEAPVASYTLELGPILDEDGNPIENARLDVEIGGAPYFATTNEDGIAVITLPSKPPAGTYTVTVSKDGFKDSTYDITIDDQGAETQGTIPAMKEEKEDEADNTVLIIVIVIIIVIIVVLMVVMLMRKKPEEAEEEAAEEEGEAAGEFECPACGAIVSADEKVCPECGEEFEEEVFKCPECGTELEPDVDTCEACGATFEPEAEEGEEEDTDEEYEVEDEEGEEAEGEEDEEMMEGDEDELVEKEGEELEGEEDEMLEEEADSELEEGAEDEVLDEEPKEEEL